MKYLVMICRGHLPVIGVGARPSHVNSDSKQFIRYFMPKGSPFNKGAILKAVRHFHLAFKGMEPEEVYDVLMEQLVTAITGYDPEYKLKIRRVAEKIDHELSKRKQCARGMNSTGTWTLIVIAISSCCVALASSRGCRGRTNRMRPPGRILCLAADLVGGVCQHPKGREI